MHESETSAEVSRREPPPSSAPEQEVPAIFQRLLVFFSDWKEELAAALPQPPNASPCVTGGAVCSCCPVKKGTSRIGAEEVLARPGSAVPAALWATCP